MTTIYLIRHSVKFSTTNIQTYYGKKDKDLMDLKIVLSSLGEKRAEILSKEDEFKNINVIYSSDMARTIATAKYLCERLNLGINIDKRLNERRYGKDNSKEYPDWFSRQFLYKDFKTEGGESQDDVSKRVLASINDILSQHKGKNIAIFSHGYAILFTLLNWCKLVKINDDRIIKIKYKNKVIFNKKINAPEAFKLIFDDNNKITNIELIEFEDLPYVKSTI